MHQLPLGDNGSCRVIYMSTKITMYIKHFSEWGDIKEDIHKRISEHFIRIGEVRWANIKEFYNL
jgi:hypothetical protein